MSQKGTHYYNEFDKGAAAWLRELMRAGLIPAGDVDERDIREVKAHEIKHYTQCHFFAGIGGWPLALRLAGWPAERSVWTGSCPCQPFSAAGKGEGAKDDRHVWPFWLPLIRDCRPPAIFGEQVAAAIRHGWLDGICADLEGADYAVGAHVLGAHSVGAPHIRQRLYWVAYAESAGGRAHAGTIPGGESEGLRQPQGENIGRPGGEAGRVSNSGAIGGRLADSNGGISGDGELQRGGEQRQQREDGGVVRLANAARGGFGIDGSASGRGGHTDERSAADGWMGEPIQPGLERHAGHGDDGNEPGRIDAQPLGPTATAGNPWDSFDWLPCTDGKARRVEPGTFPLAHGVPARVVRLRGYGNAINPYVAAEFIKACEEVTQESN